MQVETTLLRSINVTDSIRCNTPSGQAPAHAADHAQFECNTHGLITQVNNFSMQHDVSSL